MAILSTIAGVRFFCRQTDARTPAAPLMVCPRLPAPLATKMPVTVELIVWNTTIRFLGEALATDSLTVK